MPVRPDPLPSHPCPCPGHARPGLLTRLLPLATLAGGALACSGAAAGGDSGFPPTPEPRTTASLVGHRCGGGACECRKIGAPGEETEQTAPAAGTKRFELRLESSTGEVWVDVHGVGTFYKGNERAEECFYVDLRPGKYAVNVRGKGENDQGVGVGFAMHEYNPQGWWYDAFVFQCGVPGACEKETLVDFKRRAEADRRSFRDPCGSTNVSALTWETGRMPDAIHPAELAVRFALTVGAREPTDRPRDPSCPLK